MIQRYALAGLIVMALDVTLTAGPWQCEGHWLRFRGKPILLVGDSITQGWMELGTHFDQKAYVDALGRRGINVILLWSYIGVVDQASDARVGYDAPEIWPWMRTAPGPFDLTRFNDAYFDRLRELIRLADANGIVIVIQVHDGWTKTKFAGHPFNVTNGGALTDKAQFVELHDYEHEMPVIFDLQWTWQQKHQFYLERFCARLIRATADAPNVMFEIFNEGEWYDARRLHAFQKHFLDFFKVRTALPLIINDDHLRTGAGFRGELQADLLSHHTPRWDNLPAARVFFDHYSREFIATPVKPMFFSEPVPSYEGGDTANEDAMLRLLWGTALGGASVVIQNDASFGFDPRSPMAAQAAQRNRVLDLEGHLARFFHQSGVDFTSMAPNGRLTSTGVCLANVGIEYVVYALPGKGFTVNLGAARDTTFRGRWYNPHTGQSHPGDQVVGGNDAQPFMPPWSGDAVLHLSTNDRRQP